MAVVTLMTGISLAAEGKITLLPALVLGYFLGAAYFLSVGFRLKSIVGKTKEAAKREMLWGMFLRLVPLFIALGCAIKISFNVFLTVTAGLAVFYVLALVHLIFADIGMNILQEEN